MNQYNLDNLDFWYYGIGVNTIPIDSQSKTTTIRWSEYQNKPISESQYKIWKERGDFDNGIAIIVGKIWRGKYEGKYLACIDIDNKKGIEEFLSHFGRIDSLEKLGQKTIVEQHKDDPNKAHVYFITEKPLGKKSGIANKKTSSSNLTIYPSIEVKSEGNHGIMIVSPSVHKNGHRYEIIGVKELTILDNQQSDWLEYTLKNIYEHYGLIKDKEYNITPIENLFDQDFAISEGNNRHEALLRIMESLIQRLQSVFQADEIKKYAKDWNSKHCKPPLDDTEFERQWNDAIKFIEKKGASIKKDNKIEGRRENSDIEELLSSVQQRYQEIFLDQLNDVYITININDHYETIPIESKRFENLIVSEYYENEKALLSKEKLNNIIGLIKSKAELSPDIEMRELSLRVAKTVSPAVDTIYPSNKIHVKDNEYFYYYDLINPSWEIIKITSQGWELVSENKNPIFKRYKNNIPQAYPNRDYKLTIVKEFLGLFNIDDKENEILLLVYLVSLFIPDISKPILIVRGTKGAAKTTAFELLKGVVDPSNIDTLSFPKEVNDIIQTLSHNYVSYFDNISSISDQISDQISDLMCRAVTGTGYLKRKLYTDDDDVVYKFKRCCGINGINLASVKPDFLDRSLIIELKRISKDKRRKDEEIKSEFKHLLPDILGWIFHTLTKVLKYKNENPTKLELRDLPRMAEFAEYGEIISRCIGYTENEFIDAYSKNIEIQNEEVVESSIIARVLLDFMENREQWRGSATDLHSILSSFVESKDDRIIKNRSWPNAANSLSRKINELIPTLKEKGMEISHDYDNKRKTRMITITNMEKISLLSSYRSSSDSDVEQVNSEQEIGDFFPSTNRDEENKTESPEMNTAMSNDISKEHKRTDVQANIHEIADRLYPGSDTWVCKNCIHKGDRFDLISHLPYCKNNKH